MATNVGLRCYDAPSGTVAGVHRSRSAVTKPPSHELAAEFGEECGAQFDELCFVGDLVAAGVLEDGAERREPDRLVGRRGAAGAYWYAHLMLAEKNRAITNWGAEATAGTRLSGGNRSGVWAADVHHRRCTLRQSRRTPEALDWELDLIEFLDSNGIAVPRVMPTVSGERRWGAFFVLSWIDGRPPRTDHEWAEVARTLHDVHELTRSWAQRPTFASTTDLLTIDCGGDVDLSLMPPDVVRRCREAWEPLIGARSSAIHGDPKGNALVMHPGVALIDWDEARVDASILDLADLPGEQAPRDARAMGRRAASAWEAAASWTQEPEYAQRRLAELSERA